MPELIAVGPEPKQRWRRQIPDSQVIRLGRAPRNGWAVPWDRHISREHAELEQIGGNRLRVRRLDVARNYILYKGEPCSDFTLDVGEEFRIGLTSFVLADVDVGGPEQPPIEEQSFRPGDLKRYSFRNANHRLEVLSELPRVISEASSNEELALGLVGLLLDAISYAGAAAVMQFPPNVENVDPTQPLMIRWDSRDESRFVGSGDHGRFRPSRRLIKQALETGESLLHIWNESEEVDPQFTTSGRFDWAFCTPIKDVSCRGWCLYVSGRLGLDMTSSSKVVSEDDLRGDLRFSELVAEFIGAIRRVQALEQQQAGLCQFFSPAVMEMVRHSNASEMLAPRESDITILFCDVRGFSRKAEQAQHDLHNLLDRVSDALGLMTCGILKYDGVIADFQGDAALGFWGWPAPSNEGPLPAVRAALEIYQELTKSNETTADPQSRFRIGIGIAHGRAIAGKIGTDEQAKIGVFGPVVNLGSRLEGMTKMLRVPILIDEVTANAVRRSLPPDVGRCRRLGRIRPYGLDTPLMVSELLPPENYPGTISNQMIVDYDDAVDAFLEGRWDDALEILDTLPVRDRAKDFLLIYMAKNNYEPPANWDGVINLSSKE